MASLALAVAGSYIGGAMAGGTAAVAFGMTGAQLGWMGGAMLGSVLFPPKMPDGPRLDDLSVQVSSYGASITRLWGTSRIAGNVIWSTDLVEHAQEQGGKLLVDLIEKQVECATVPRWPWALVARLIAILPTAVVARFR